MTAAFTATEKREAALREVKMRRRVYPRWIEGGRLKPETAQREIELMDAIAEDYRVAAEAEAAEKRRQGSLFEVAP